MKKILLSMIVLFSINSLAQMSEPVELSDGGLLRTGQSVFKKGEIVVHHSEYFKETYNSKVEFASSIQKIIFYGEASQRLTEKLKSLPEAIREELSISHVVSGNLSFSDEVIIFSCKLNGETCTLSYSETSPEFEKGKHGLGYTNFTNLTEYDLNSRPLDDPYSGKNVRRTTSNSLNPLFPHILFARNNVANVFRDTDICEFEINSAREDIGGGGSSSSCFLDLAQN